MLEKRQTVAEQVAEQVIILYLSAIELTCQTASEKRQTVSDKLQKHVRLKLIVQSKIFYVKTLLFNIFFK